MMLYQHSPIIIVKDSHTECNSLAETIPTQSPSRGAPHRRLGECLESSRTGGQPRRWASARGTGAPAKYFLDPEYQTMVLYRRRRPLAKKSAPKRAYVRRAGIRKGRAIRRAGGRSGYRKLIQSMAGMVTNSLWSYKGPRLSPRVRAMKMVGSPNIQHKNFATTLSSVAGLQVYASYGTLIGIDLTALQQAVPHNEPNRLVVESSQTEITLTNSNNCAAEIELYDVMFKRDVSVDQTLNTNSGTYTFTTIDQMWEQGAKASAGEPPGGTDVSRYIGASPFDSQPFKTFCRVVKRTHVMLASGASHRHQSQIGINKLIDASLASDLTKAYVKGFSYATLIVARGVAAYAPADPPVGGSTVNSVFINVATATRIKYTYVQDVTQNVHYNNYPLSTSTVNVRNIGSGAYEPASF